MRLKFNDKTLILMLLTGLLLKLSLALLPGFKIDVDAWFAWAFRLTELPFSEFYSDQVWTNYTPGYLYILWLSGLINNLFNLIPEQFYFLLKVPSIVAEIFLAFISYHLVKSEVNIKWARVTAAFILFNPGFIFNSSIWGQVDGFLSLLMFLSIFFLSHKKLSLASIFFALSILIKPQALALSPIFLFYVIKNFNKQTINLIYPGLLTLLILSFPFFVSNPLLGLPYLIIQMSNDYASTSLFAYNFWGIVGFWIDDQKNFLGLTYQMVGIVLFVTFWILTAYFYFKKNLNLYIISTLACLAFYFLPTRAHERYLYPALVFAAISAAYLNSQRIFILTSLLSLTYLINLYYVYIYYNVFYSHTDQSLYLKSFYDLLNRQGRLLSFISTALFGFLSFNLIKYGHKKIT